MEIHYYNLLNSGTILKGEETSFRGDMPEFISRTSTDTNPLLGLYSMQTLKSDILSSTELDNDRVGANDYRRKENAFKTITEFSSSSNPLLAYEVFTTTKRNLLEAGKTYSDVFILDIGQQGSLAEDQF